MGSRKALPQKGSGALPRREPPTTIRVAVPVKSLLPQPPAPAPSPIAVEGEPICSGHCGHCDCHPCRLHGSI